MQLIVEVNRSEYGVVENGVKISHKSLDPMFSYPIVRLIHEECCYQARNLRESFLINPLPFLHRQLYLLTFNSLISLKVVQIWSSSYLLAFVILCCPSPTLSLQGLQSSVSFKLLFFFYRSISVSFKPVLILPLR